MCQWRRFIPLWLLPWFVKDGAVCKGQCWQQSREDVNFSNYMDAQNKFELGVDKLYWYTFLLQQHALLSIFLRSHDSKQENYFRHKSRSELATSHNTTCITSEHYIPLFAANYPKKGGQWEPLNGILRMTIFPVSCEIWGLFSPTPIRSCLWCYYR